MMNANEVKERAARIVAGATREQLECFALTTIENVCTHMGAQFMSEIFVNSDKQLEFYANTMIDNLETLEGACDVAPDESECE